MMRDVDMTKQIARFCLRAIAGVALTGLVAVAGCGANSATTRVSEGDPADAFRPIAHLRSAGAFDVIEPRRLVDALPNRQIAVKTDGGTALGSFSDLVVTGRIAEVAPDEGIRYPHADPAYEGDEEADSQAVAFADPAADERTAIVTFDVDWSAGDTAGNVLKFRIAVPPGADPEKFLSGVKGIGNAAVLLDRFDNGRYAGEYHPILNYAGLGQVEADGTVRFAGLGEQEAGFTDGIDTLDQLKREAERPPRTLEY